MTRRRDRRGELAGLLALVLLVLCALVWPGDPPVEVGPEPPMPETPPPEPVPVPVAPEPPPAPAAPAPPPEPEPPVPEPPEPPAATTDVSGVVLYEGEPVPRARVLCVDDDGTHVAGWFGARTGEDGTFTIPAADAAFPVTIEVVAVGFLPLERKLDRGTAGLELSLEKGLRISGVLLDEERNPVPSAVGALRLDARGNRIPRRGNDAGLFSRCDEMGRFEITGLTPGKYEVFYSGGNYARVEGSSAVCSAGDAGVEIHVRRACALRLDVVDAALLSAPRGTLTIHLTDRSANVRTVTAPGGKVTLRGLAPGDYTLRISAPGYEVYDKPTLRLRRPGEVEEIRVPLERRDDWGFGEVRVSVTWPEELSAREDRPELWVRIVRNEDPSGGRDFPPRRFESGDLVTLPATPAGTHRLYAWTLDSRWVARPVRVEVEKDRTSEAALVLTRGGVLVPVLSLPEGGPDRTALAFVLRDERGDRLSVAWADRVPGVLTSLGPLPPGRVTVDLVEGERRIASGTAVVVPGKKTEVQLR